MRYLLKGGQVYRCGSFVSADVSVEMGVVSEIAPFIDVRTDDCVLDCSHCFLIPGLADVHVHLREPGFLYKETVETGTLAAARGGYTAVCSMPNLNPAPDTLEHLQVQLDAIEKDAKIAVYPYGCITLGQKGRGETVDFDALASRVIGFSDDGRGVQEESLMRKAMQSIASTGRVLAAHCEDESLLRGGYIHDGEYAKAHGHKGICSESETAQVVRDLKLVKETGVKYHVCHVSAKETVEAIRKAKREGVDVTCETGPHYLLLTDTDLQEDGRFKMNPPLRGEEDRKALLEGILDGTVDMIATDHAPHSAEEKSRGLAGSLMGVVGLECAFRVLYTELVLNQKLLTLEKLVEIMCIAPRKRFMIPGGLEVGMQADIALIDPEIEGEVDPEAFLSKGRATPFAGMKTRGDIVMTMHKGNIVYRSERM
ncbi:MAG: dihydroorotase [Clostridia bacterium]|nr:dihydroorotase [Clostridia bacterium]